VTAKSKARPKHAGHTTTTVHGNTRTTVTHAGHTTTTTRTTAHGAHRTSVTTVKTGGKVTSTTTRKYVVVKARPKPKTKATAKKRGAIAPSADGFWVTGDNDRLETCVPVALANSLLIVTGLRVADWQVRALAGLRAISDVLGALDVPFRPAEGLHDGVILGVAGAHAVTVHDGALVSWGAEYPLDGLGAVEEAWEVGWSVYR
jgi:hypothetical protein